MIYGGYRNDEWYDNLFKKMSKEDAYEAVVENLKNPTFLYEKDSALRVYKKVFGVEFKSKELNTIDVLSAENAKLRAELAVKGLPVQNENLPFHTVDEPLEEKDILDEEDDMLDEKHEIAFVDFPKGMSKAAFRTFYFDWFKKTQGSEPAPVVWGRAWKKYNPAHEDQA